MADFDPQESLVPCKSGRLVVPRLCASAATDSLFPRLFDTFPQFGAARSAAKCAGGHPITLGNGAHFALVRACGQPVAFSQAVATETKQI